MTAGSTPRAAPPAPAPPNAASPEDRASLRRSFSAFKYPRYRYLWFSMAAGMTGMQMQMIARGLLAYELAGSFTAVGIVFMAWGIPQFFFALIGGAIADRMDKRKILLLTQVLVLAQALAVGVLVTLGEINIPILFAFGVFLGATFSFNMPARQAIIPEVVPPDELMNAIALNSAAMNATRLVSPVVAGILVTTLGFDWTYYVTAVLYGVAMLPLLFLPASTSHLQGAKERGNIRHEIRVGLRYILGQRQVRLMMLMAFVPIVIGMPYVTILPAFAVDELGRGNVGYSVMVALSALGALFGSLLIASLRQSTALRGVLFSSGFVWGLGLVGLGVGSMMFGYTAALVAMVVVGFASMSYMTLNSTMILTTTDPAYHGRVMSLYMLTFGVFPLMGAPLGILADRFGGAEMFTALGLGVLIFFVLVVVLSPNLAGAGAGRRPAAASDEDGGVEAAG